jgi:hypothetical protein
MKGLTSTTNPSKILEKRWRMHEKDLHKQKLRNVKSSIREQYQSAPFGSQGALQNFRNGKKEALMECKYFSLK